MKLVYDVNERPPIRKNLVYAFQQVLAIMAATLLVPVLVNSGSGTAYIWDDNVWGESYPADRTIPLPVTSANQSYIKTIIAGQNFDMLPRTIGGSSVTGLCDGHWISSNGRLLCVGGSAYYGSICGLSASAADNGFSSSYAHLGARLAFYGEPEEVRGSETVAFYGEPDEVIGEIGGEL